MPKPSTCIHKLELENFRAFESLEIDFHDELTVLVADNGQGKTAVIDAVAIAWRLFVDTMLLESSSRGFLKSDIRLAIGPDNVMEAILPTTLAATGQIGGSLIEWSRELNSDAPNARTTFVNASDLVNMAVGFVSNVKHFADGKIDKPPLLPLIARYSTGRLWSQHRRTSRTYDVNRTSGYIDALSPSSSYKMFVDWFRRVSLDAKRRQPKAKLGRVDTTNLLKAVVEAVDLVLSPSGWYGIHWDPFFEDVYAYHEEMGVLPVSLLSDGVRNVIGLVADVAHRAARLNPQLGAKAATKTPGILLIDEVDMHLHPRWQQLIIGLLRQAFPSMQMILSTHSPQALSTLRPENIRILRVEDGEGSAEQPQYNPYGHSSTRSLEGVQGVDAYPPLDILEDLREYQRLVGDDQHDTAKAQKLRKKLEHEWGPHDPELLLLDVTIRKNETLRKLRTKG